MSNPVYLSDRVHLEPVINQWYAVPFLLSPVTAALVTRNHQLRIMESYVRTPQLHAQAIRSAALLGGPFLDYEGDVDHIRALIATFRRDLAPALQLADDVRASSLRLAEECRGTSMESVYATLPESLRGYVELVYDTMQRASLRFIEPLLFRSPMFNCHKHGIVMSLRERDTRTFLLSSPRMCGPDEIQLEFTWADELTRRLYALRDRPMPLDEAYSLLEAAGLDPRKRKLARTFLTEQPPIRSRTRNMSDQGVRIRSFGHACLLVQTADVAILTDPLISYNVEGIPRFCYNDLPDHIDYVVITHAHQDHLILESLLQIRDRVGAIVVPKSQGGRLQDPSPRLMLQFAGFDNVIELGELESIKVPGGEILGIPFLGEHGDLDIAAKLAYVLRLQNTTVMCAADANNLDPYLYRHLRSIVGHVDVLFLGMECDGAPMSWLYGPLLARTMDRQFDQQRRLNGSNAQRAAGILEAFDVDALYVYAMGAEPWMSHISAIRYTDASVPILESDKLIAACRDRQMAARRLFGKEEVFA